VYATVIHIIETPMHLLPKINHLDALPIV